MEIREITKDILEELEDIIDPEAAEYIGRDNYKGIELYDAVDGEHLGGMAWELLTDEEGKKEAEIRWFYFSGTGSGELIFDAYDEEAEKAGVVRTVIELLPGDEKAEELLIKRGFDLVLAESRDLYVPLSELQGLKERKRRTDNTVKSIGELSSKQLEKAIRECVKKSKKHVRAGLEKLPMYYFFPEVSSAMFDREGGITGLLLIHETPLRNLKVEFVSATGAEAGKCILDMIDFSLGEAQKLCPGSLRVLIRRRGKEESALTDRLIPAAQGRDVVLGERTW